MVPQPKRLYDCRWERLARRVLQEEHYQCYFEGCERRATSTDHIVPVLEAPHLRLVRSNCRASCSKHNFGRANVRAAAIIRANRTVGTRRQW